MKKFIMFCIVLVSFLTVLFTASVQAGSSGAPAALLDSSSIALEAGFHSLGSVTLPSTVDNPYVREIVKDWSWDCGGGTMVTNLSVEYYYVVKFPNLNEQNKRNLQAICESWLGIGKANCTGEIHFDAAQHEIRIPFAYQDYTTEVSQSYNPETDQWECQIMSELTASPVDYYQQGLVEFGVENFRRVLKTK